ncbi:MAG: PIN domain-containing protein [Oscillospiraceae bacterium]|jgi:tRNA(fMet)-specific endonuclease VapC|nr:PIN domain-containing protein [Oscillospiraceae bacterium]
MRFLLDSNIIAYYLNNKYESIRIKLQQAPQCDVGVPSIVQAELLYGACKSDRAEHNFRRLRALLSCYEIVQFDSQAAEAYGRIRVHLEKSGQPVGGNDMLIAAVALANGAALVTHNTREFARVPNLMLVDWVQI